MDIDYTSIIFSSFILFFQNNKNIKKNFNNKMLICPEVSSNENSESSDSRRSGFNMVDVNDPTIIKFSDFLDYRFVEYYVRMAFGSKNSVSIIAMHNIKNEEMLTKLEENDKKVQWTYGWCQLPPAKYPKEIGMLKTKGYTLDSNHSFLVGNIPAKSGGLGHEYFYLFCKLIIGNSLCVKADKKITTKKIPNYYNSYKLLTPENMNIQLNLKDINNAKDITFKYDIFNPSFICPLYVVKLEQTSESMQKNMDNYFCCKCRQKEAEVFCLVCEEFYDRECYNIKHKPKGKNELNHGPFQVLKYKQKQGICAEHETREAEYYCLTCKKPICSRCKIMVNQKANQHINHQVKEIFEAYEQMPTNHYIANDIRRRAVEQLKRIKGAIKTLIEKQYLIEKEIDHEFGEENDSIQALTKDAKLKHFSVIAELNEMKKHLINMDNYFHKCETAMISANLNPEAIWIQDNYEEVITDMFSNFDTINLDYKVSPRSFLKIKQTNLRITNKIEAEEKPLGVYEEEMNRLMMFDKDKQYELTKKIVSLKTEKEEAKKNKDKDQQKKNMKRFADSNDPLKYVLDERVIEKQKEITENELEKEKKKEEEEKKKEMAKKNLKALKANIVNLK